MSLVVLRTMLLALWRDKGALALTFALPVAFFLVFAAIFAGGSGDAARIDVAIADEGGTDETGRLCRAIARDEVIRAVDAAGKVSEDPLPRLTADDVRALVRAGKADAGLIVHASAGEAGALFGGLGADAGPPLTLVEDSAKGIAAQILRGMIQKAYMNALPDVTARGGIELFTEQAGPLTPEQAARWDRALSELRRDAIEGDQAGEGEDDADIEEIIEREQVTGRTAGQNHVAYYAGAVAVLFLLFAAAHGASVLLDEREAGILDRVLAGPSGFGPLLGGKFLFLVLLGFVQVTTIFAVAWLLRGVDLPGKFAGFAVVTLATSAAAAGLALALTAACATRRQANNVTTIGILIVSAVGGSMVPRFLMPEFLRTLGWLTPNTWALEAYTKIFWRDEALASLAVPVAVLAGVAVLGYAIARLLTRRWEAI